jgi:cyclopropane-fatty-acyl-phospholipid synthase
MTSHVRSTSVTTRDAGTRQPTAGSVADVLAPVLRATVGERPPVRFIFWDDSAVGATDGPGTVRVHVPQALRRVLWAPGELGIARAYVAGDLDVEGDIFGVLRALRDATPDDLRFGADLARTVFTAARRLDALGPPPSPPPEEAHPHGVRHSVRRDAAAISHHYDVGNDFYRLVLGPSMTYSSAHFTTPDDDLATAQAAKHELICRKLGLHRRPGMRLLDVGCGWGTMALHAAAEHGARVIGITISAEQADLARHRVAEAGMGGQVEIRLQDYRDLHGEQFDAISSVGMSEHVGAGRLDRYFATLARLLVPRGRLLNQAISSVDGSRLRGRSFAGRYVFPDGELIDLGETVLAMEHSGLEVRDVESLREHYALTLRAWVANLEAEWDRAVALVGRGRARVWRLYMAGSAIGFEDNGLATNQILGVRTADDGVSGMPATRDWR